MKTNASEKASKNKPRFVPSILLVLLLGACTSQTAPPTPSLPIPTATPLPPAAVATPTDTPIPLESDDWPTEGWRTSTPEEQGMDSEKLAELMSYLQEQKSFDIHSLLIIRNGHVVTDAFFYPFAPGMLHDLASATKSFTSSLIGIAIDKGYIQGVEQPVLDIFSERSVANVDANKRAMTLEDLLTMRSGFACTGESTSVQMMASPDWVQFALDQPMASEPGTRYNYCGLNSHLLSAMIQETTGMSALEFAQEHLFGPLGISGEIWPADPQGNNWGWGDLKMAAHDMAKLGYLFLNEGLWDGQQVVSAEWVNAATGSQQSTGYGYQWWLKSSGYYFATGVGGQEIWVLPDRDMVVVLTGASGGGGSGAWGDQLMRSYIIPLAESSAPLPPNPEGVADLDVIIQAAAAPPQPEPVPPMPEIAQRVAGRTFVMEANPAGLQSVSLAFPEEAKAVLRLSFMDGVRSEWPIGLDSLYRFSPGEHGLLAAAKGWWKTDNEFVVDRDAIGSSNRERYRQRLSAVFEDDQVTVSTEGVTLVGRLEE